MAASALRAAAGASAGHLSRSTTVTMGAVSGHHIFRVKGYSQTKGIANGLYMTLGSFDVGGHSWSVRYYPNGSGGYKDYMSFFVSRDNDLCSTGMPARYGLSMLGPDGNPVVSFTEAFRTRAFHQMSYGIPNFMEREEFEKSPCLTDDSFTIRCDIHVAAAEPSNEETGHDDGAPPPAVVPPKSDLQKDLADLLWNKQGTDVTIDVGGETFHAHRWLLAARSAEFKETFFGPTEKKAAARIQIQDMEPKVFKSLLHFMYTDTLPKMGEEAMSEMAGGLLAAADRYKVERLKTICEEMLCKRVDTSTVATSLVLSEKHNCRALKAACMEFLSSPVNLETVMANDGLEIVKTSCPAVLLELTMKLLAQEKQRTPKN
ncbi:hypothetical protein ACP70R_049345 [Stipagrostis hirtigluma subsp. patula]